MVDELLHRERLLFFGRFGGLSESEIFEQIPNASEVLPLTPTSGSKVLGGLELFSRSVHLPPVDLCSWETLPDVPNTFVKSGFYTACRLLHETHFRRHFINSGWQPTSLSSLESLNLSVEIAHHLITQKSITKLVFETVPHNTFDTVLYFVGRHLGLECLVFRDVGYFGGTRVYVNPLDDWPDRAFEQAVVFPPEMRVTNFRISEGVQAIRLHTARIHRHLSGQMGSRPNHTMLVNKITNILSSLVAPTREVAVMPSPASVVRSENLHLELRTVYEPESRDTGYSQLLPAKGNFSHTLESRGYKRSLLRPNLFGLQGIERSKFIYLSVAHQPEQTTSVLGLVYEDHHYFLRRLLRIFPSDYIIVVRDHPLQSSMIAYPRTRSFLASFLTSPRVRVASQEIPVDSLIQGSKAVALVNGSAGFEALNVGRPVIYGGSPDYANWAGTIQLDDLEGRSHQAVEAWISSQTNFLSSLGKQVDDLSETFRPTTTPGWASLTETLESSELEDNKRNILSALKFLAERPDRDSLAV